MYGGWSVFGVRARTKHKGAHQPFFPYLHNHEYFALDRVLLVSVGVRARDQHEQTRPDQPFLLTCLLLPDQ